MFTKVSSPCGFGFEDQVRNAVSFRSYQQLLLADNSGTGDKRSDFEGTDETCEVTC